MSRPDAPRPLLQDDGSGSLHRQLAELSVWHPRDAGRVTNTFTPNPPWWLTLPWVLLGLVLLVLAYPLNPDFFPVAALVIVVIFGGVALAAWLWARSQKTRIAEHALLLGPRRRVIPYASIDPGRVAIATRTRYLGRHIHSGGTRVLQSQGAVAVINGLNPDPSASSPHAPPSTVPSPFCEWGLSGEPLAVLSVLEAAMVVDGWPAHGMTERAQAHTFTPQKPHPADDVLRQRRALDPPIGVRG